MRNEALHAAVLAAPDDDGPRLVYADWLLAHGDPRGELISVQVELARTPDGERRQELLAREHALWAAHGDVWRPKLEKLEIELERGFIKGIACTDMWRLAAHIDDLLNWACLERLSFHSPAEIDLQFIISPEILP